MGIALLALWEFTLFWGYFLLFEWLWNGQTLGKRALGIRVIQNTGTALTFYHAAVRNIVRFVDSLPGAYAVGFVVAACNRENLRLGDLAAGTLVVHVEERVKPIRAMVEGRTEADHARQALWRQRLASLAREQKQTLLDLCLRRDQLRVAERHAAVPVGGAVLREPAGAGAGAVRERREVRAAAGRGGERTGAAGGRAGGPTGKPGPRRP